MNQRIYRKGVPGEGFGGLFGALAEFLVILRHIMSELHQS